MRKRKPVTKKSDMTALKGPLKKIKSFSVKPDSKDRKYATLTCGHKRTCYKTVQAESELRCRPCRPGAKQHAVKRTPVKAAKKSTAKKKQPVKREPVAAHTTAAAASA
jgi:hypothetical protein